MNSKTQIVFFRVDAPIETGAGHIRRCFTLTDALTRDRAEWLFKAMQA